MYLDVGVSSQFGPCVPIVLIEWIFNRNHGELFDELLVEGR